MYKFCVLQYTNSTYIYNNTFCVCLIKSPWNLCHNIEKIALSNNTKHNRVCKSVTEIIKDNATNIPNTPRINMKIFYNKWGKERLCHIIVLYTRPKRDLCMLHMYISGQVAYLICLRLQLLPLCVYMYTSLRDFVRICVWTGLSKPCHTRDKYL